MNHYTSHKTKKKLLLCQVPTTRMGDWFWDDTIVAVILIILFLIIQFRCWIQFRPIVRWERSLLPNVCLLLKSSNPSVDLSWQIVYFTYLLICALILSSTPTELWEVDKLANNWSFSVYSCWNLAFSSLYSATVTLSELKLMLLLWSEFDAKCIWSTINPVTLFD